MSGVLTTPIFPFKTILEATPEMAAESADWVANDMSDCVFGQRYFEEMATELLTVPLRTGLLGLPDNTVWNVYAEEYPGASKV